MSVDALTKQIYFPYLDVDRRTGNENWKPYVIEGNVEMIEEAKVVVYLERHTDPKSRTFNGKMLDSYYQEGDTIFTEDWASIPAKEIRYTPQDYMQRKEVKIEGWLCPKAKSIFEDFIEQEANTWKAAYELVDESLRSFTPKDTPLFGPLIQRLTNLKEAYRNNHRSSLDQISGQLFPQNQNFLTSLLETWLRENISNSQHLYIVAGRHHGNQHLKNNRFKKEVVDLLDVLNKTQFLIIDFHKKEAWDCNF